MTSYKVVVANLGYESYEIEENILQKAGAEISLVPQDCTTEDQVIAAAREADALLVREAPVTERVLDSLKRCKGIVRYGVGVDNIDLEAARRKSIYVANVPGYGTEEVSDHAVALLLACVRTLTVRDRRIRAGKFETDINDNIFRTTGKNLGLIGYGQIGRAVHRKWKGFLPGRVLIHDPYCRVSIAPDDVAELTDLDSVLTESHYISLHAPLTAETRHLIDERALQMMKPTAILVNTARGELIDENALVKALKEERIFAAGLDVFEREPLPEEHPLLSLPNAILSGHVGWYSKDAVRELQTRAAKEVLRILSGGKPQCWVNTW